MPPWTSAQPAATKKTIGANCAGGFRIRVNEPNTRSASETSTLRTAAIITGMKVSSWASSNESTIAWSR